MAAIMGRLKRRAKAALYQEAEGLLNDSLARAGARADSYGWDVL
jgi:hypothetical protein